MQVLLTLPVGRFSHSSTSSDGVNGYLIVNKVEIFGTGVRVSGEMGYFFSTFEEAKLSIQSADAVTEGKSGTIPPAPRPVITTLVPSALDLTFVQFVLQGSLTSRLDTRFDIEIDCYGFDMKVDVDFEFSAKVNFDMTFQIPGENVDGTKPLMEIPIPGASLPLHIFKIFKTLQLVDELASLDQIQIWLVFTVDLVAAIEKLAFVQKVGPFLEFDTTTGRKIMRLHTFFKPCDFDAGMDAGIIYDAGSNSEVKYGLRDLTADNLQLEFEAASVGLDLSLSFKLTENVRIHYPYAHRGGLTALRFIKAVPYLGRKRLLYTDLRPQNILEVPVDSYL